MKVISYINTGNSFPIIIEDKTSRYFVKLRAGMSGKYGLASEWLGNRMAIELGIKAQSPSWIDIENDIEIDNIHIEVKELIHKSIGLNIGFKYQENALACSLSELDKIDKIDKKEAETLFLFDIMMINVDRTSTNTNLMSVANDIISVDYESSLLIQELLGNRSLLADKSILEGLRNSPLYRDVEEDNIDAFTLKMEAIPFEELVEKIPLAVLNKDERTTLLLGVEKKQKDKWNLKKTIHNLKNIKIETKEEQKRRINKNQAEFKRKFKENLSASNDK